MPIAESTTPPDLRMSVDDSQEGVLVCLRGRVSIDSSPKLRDLLLAIFGRDSLPTLTIDLAEVTYLDASAIATLVESLKIARARKTTLLLRGLRDRPLYLLEITGLLHLFQTKGQTNGSSVPKVL